MAEKKTFKNPWLSTTRNPGPLSSMDDSVEAHTWGITISEGLGNPYGSFSSEEWDMEVAFTKKEKPIEIGDKVRFVGMSWMVGHTFEVVAVYTNWLLVFEDGYTDEEPMVVDLADVELA